jgi:hypothetical protein
MSIRLYDPTRTPARWPEIVRPGQFRVFFPTASDGAPKDENAQVFLPGEDSVEIADSLPEALRFAEETVSRHPELCAEIYGHEGKTGEPVRTVYNPSVRGKYEGAALGKHHILTGLCVLSAPVIAHDAAHGLR